MLCRFLSLAVYKRLRDYSNLPNNHATGRIKVQIVNSKSYLNVFLFTYCYVLPDKEFRMDIFRKFDSICCTNIREIRVIPLPIMNSLLYKPALDEYRSAKPQVMNTS